MFQLLASEPERDVLLAVLAEEELPEEFTARVAPHQFIEGRAPRPDLLQAALHVSIETVQAVESVPRVAQFAVFHTRVPFLLPLIDRASCACRISPQRRQTVNFDLRFLLVCISIIVRNSFRKFRGLDDRR